MIMIETLTEGIFGDWTQRWRLMGVSTRLWFEIEAECFMGPSASECYCNVTFALKTNCTGNIWPIKSVRPWCMCGKAWQRAIKGNPKYKRTEHLVDVWLCVPCVKEKQTETGEGCTLSAFIIFILGASTGNSYSGLYLPVARQLNSLLHIYKIITKHFFLQ